MSSLAWELYFHPIIYAHPFATANIKKHSGNDMICAFVSFFTVCIGTNGRLSVPTNKEHHYQNLRDRYTNCTYVDGNLELTWLMVCL